MNETKEMMDPLLLAQLILTSALVYQDDSMSEEMKKEAAWSSYESMYQSLEDPLIATDIMWWLSAYAAAIVIDFAAEKKVAPNELLSFYLVTNGHE